jgi:DNA (cytosine-5)-methyltransferase 1
VSRPRLLDLFCGAGGAAMGYHRAGFDVFGVDIKPQPRYPFPFRQGDALDVLKQHGHEFDAIHASPPCQAYTKQAKQKGTAASHPALIGEVRSALVTTNRPWVIENVLEARADLISPVMLCGVMFELGVFRHRLFETSWTLPGVEHRRHPGRIGDGRFVSITGSTGGRSVRDGIQHGRKRDWQRAIGINWMTVDELAQAVPPAYAEHVGRAMLAAVSARGRDASPEPNTSDARLSRVPW